MKTTSRLLAVPLFAAFAVLPWLLAISSVSCSNGNGNTGGSNGGGSSSGGSGGTGGNGWTIVPLDTSDGGDQSDMEIAIGKNDTVGVAYYHAYTGDAGAPQDFTPYLLEYVQYANGQVTPPSYVDTVYHPAYGLGLAMQASGLPAIAYLGGIPYGTGAAASIYWVQSQAVVSYQQANGTWTQEVADDAQNDPIAQTVNGNSAEGGLTDYGATGVVVLGLFSAIGFDSTGVGYDYFRDVHFGTSIGTTSDLGSSNINGEVGGPTAWTPEWAFAGNTWDPNGGTPALGLGGHIRLVMTSSDQPALVTDEFGQTPGDDSSGQNVDFTMRLASSPLSDWSLPQRILGVGATQTGPSMAYNPTFGYAVTSYDSKATKLLFTSSKDGVTWEKALDVYAGAGGWFPSIAISPITETPVIADFLCSNQSGPTAIGECPPSEQAIEVRTYSGSAFQPGTVVDPAGGYRPRIAFLSTGKMVIAYRQLPYFNLVLAVQQ